MLRIGPRKLRRGGFERGFGHAPLGAHRGVARKQIGERRLGLARYRFGIAQLSGDARRCGFRIAEPGLKRLPLFIELGDGVLGIALKRLLARQVVGQGCGKPFELDQPPADGVAPRPRARELMSQFVTRFARFGERRTLARERFIGGTLRRLRFGDSSLDRCYFLGRGIGLGGRGLGGALGLAPADMQQASLDRANLLRKFAIALSGAGLAAERHGALFLVAEDFAEPNEIGLGRAELLLGILAPRMQPRNSRRLLQQHAPLDRLGGDDRTDFALADQRRRMSAGRGIGEQQRDILLADVAPIDTIGRAGAALDAAGNFALIARDRVAVGALDKDRNLGEIARRAACGAGENDVVHAAAANRLGARFAHRPAERLKQVRLAATIGPDHAGQPGLDPQLGRLDEAFETAKLEPTNPQFGLPRSISRPERT